MVVESDEDGGAVIAFGSNIEPGRAFVAVNEWVGDSGGPDDSRSAATYFSAAGLRQLARELLKLADELPQCAHAYLSVGDTCEVCGGRITLDFSDSVGGASK